MTSNAFLRLEVGYGLVRADRVDADAGTCDVVVRVEGSAAEAVPYDDAVVVHGPLQAWGAHSPAAATLPPPVEATRRADRRSRPPSTSA